jgi:chromosome segregation ATPase
MLDTNAAETAKAAASDRPQILPPAAPSTAKKALESEVTPEFLEKLSWEMTQKDAEIDRLRESVNGAMLQTQQSQLLAQQQANSYLAELATRQQNLAAAESLDRHYTQILSDAEQVYDDLELENQRLRTVYRSSVQECRTLETANSTLQDSVNQCRIEISQLRSQILHLEAALQQALHEKDNDPKDPKDPSEPKDPAKPQTPEQPSLPKGGPRYGR